MRLYSQAALSKPLPEDRLATRDKISRLRVTIVPIDQSRFAKRSSNGFGNAAYEKSKGPIHSTKISGIFGQKLNGSVRSEWKFTGQSGPPPNVVLFNRSVLSDRNLEKPRSFPDVVSD